MIRGLHAAPALAGDKRDELARLASGHSAGDDDWEPPSKEDGDERHAERIDSFSVLLTLILSFTTFVFYIVIQWFSNFFAKCH